MSSALPTGGLVGRDNELALLHGLLREAARGRGNAVLIEGEPGIGKTALVRSVMAHAPEAGCEVFWGRGDELGQELPLLPFLDSLRVRQPSGSARRTAIIQLLRGEIATDRGSDVPRALAEQLLALVAEQCATRPTIIIIDDLQWADPGSVALWGRLARLTGQMSLFLVGMMRPVPQREDLLALRRGMRDSARLQLTALSRFSAGQLVEAIAGGKPDSNLLELADGAAGNPLYLTELLAALARGDSLTTTEAGTVQLSGGSVPNSLSAAIADRLGFVTGPVRDVLRAAALLGVDFAVADLATVLGRNTSDLLPAVDEACAAGVLVECGGGLGFRHPLIREALYEEMPATVRAAWHRDAGRALAAANVAVDRVARQLLRATDSPSKPSENTSVDEWLQDWLSQTADTLVGQAPAVAVELLTQVMSSAPRGTSRQGWLASRLADAYFRVGDRARAEQVANQALESAAQPGLLVDLHWTLAQCRTLAGLSAESLASLDQALTAPGITAKHRASLLVLAARTHFNLGEMEKAGEVAGDALVAASEADDGWAIGWALLVMAVVTTVQGHMTNALPMYDRALIATQGDSSLTDLRLLLQINKAVTLSNLDQYAEALDSARQARRLADQVGTTFRLSQAHGALGQLLFETGQWDDALTEISIVPENLKEPAAACNERAITALIRFHRGEIIEAQHHLAAVTPFAELIGRRLIGPLALARSLNHEHVGTLSDSLKVLATELANNVEDLEETEGLLADTVRLAMRTGDFDTAESYTDRAVALADGSPIPHRQANALYCRGMFEHDPHKLMAAAARYEDASRPLLQAKALEAGAVEFVEADERSQARDAFSRSVEVYESLGAAADVQRVLAVFRGYGIRRGPHSKHRQARSGWDSLTPMEQKIAAFVEEGLSNPEIAARLTLSRRTVGTHVSHILKKLGVSSRTNIARESALRSLTTADSHPSGHHPAHPAI